MSVENENNVVVTEADIREAYKQQFGTEPTEKQFQDFKQYIELDVGEWLKDNARSFAHRRATK
jgi:hypothetical protein